MKPGERLESLFSGIDEGITFSRRPDSIPGDLRLSWRLVALCMVLDRFRGKKASLESLHIIWWAMRSQPNRAIFGRWREGWKRPDEVIVRFDPSLSMTVDLARGEGLVSVSDSGAIVLEHSGHLMAELASQEEVLVEEREFLGGLPRLNQRMLGELVTW